MFKIFINITFYLILLTLYYTFRLANLHQNQKFIKITFYELLIKGLLFDTCIHNELR